jgi:TfoX N-terminal domain
MGAVEVEIRDRAAETLAEIERLDVRRMFGGFGFYVDGLLVAAAWEGAFRLRYREDGHWVYRPVDGSAVDDPSLLVGLVRDRVAQLSGEPHAQRPRRARNAT